MRHKKVVHDFDKRWCSPEYLESYKKKSYFHCYKYNFHVTHRNVNQLYKKDFTLLFYSAISQSSHWQTTILLNEIWVAKFKETNS